jgi:hypothetical protein
MNPLFASPWLCHERFVYPGEVSKQRQLLQCLQRFVPTKALAAVLAALVFLAADVVLGGL